MKFCEKLKKLRKEKGLTQKELANITGISLRSIQNYESGKLYPQQRDVYRRLSEVLECSEDYLQIESDSGESSFMMNLTNDSGETLNRWKEEFFEKYPEFREKDCTDPEVVLEMLVRTVEFLNRQPHNNIATENKEKHDDLTNE